VPHFIAPITIRLGSAPPCRRVRRLRSPARPRPLRESFVGNVRHGWQSYYAHAVLPESMPLVRDGRLRKRWHYAAAFDERVMLCAARVEVGPLKQTFWAVWDRERRTRYAHTRILPGRRQVDFEGPLLHIKAGDVRANLTFAPSEAIEARCPSGKRGWSWTRKRAGMDVVGTVKAGRREWNLTEARGIDDVSAGYHERHTDWLWSAGIGRAADGRAVAWNLVAGINDPPQGSERAIWLDGEPHEPLPVEFDGLSAIGFSDGSRLEFSPESERRRNDNLLIVRSRYRHFFGTFSGSLGGIPLESGMGVMEQHSAVW
jgi:uncharacterized protein DUF2804